MRLVLSLMAWLLLGTMLAIVAQSCAHTLLQ